MVFQITLFQSCLHQLSARRIASYTFGCQAGSRCLGSAASCADCLALEGIASQKLPGWMMRQTLSRFLGFLRLTQLCRLLLTGLKLQVIHSSAQVSWSPTKAFWPTRRIPRECCYCPRADFALAVQALTIHRDWIVGIVTRKECRLGFEKSTFTALQSLGTHFGSSRGAPNTPSDLGKQERESSDNIYSSIQATYKTNNQVRYDPTQSYHSQKLMIVENSVHSPSKRPASLPPAPRQMMNGKKCSDFPSG